MKSSSLSFVSTNVFVLLSLFLIVNVNINNVIVVVDAWQVCSPTDGGGICPDESTCCPTDIPGISSCIPGRKNDPDNANGGGGGECCDNGTGRTGCGYGYECALKFADTDTEIEIEIEDNNDDNEEEEEEEEKRGEEEEIEEEVCKLRDPHPSYLNAPVTPRYELCRLPSLLSSSSSSSSSLLDVLKLHGFPVDGYNAAYYSSMGSITHGNSNGKDNNSEQRDYSYMKKFSSIETILVIVHGSNRNADEYLCAGMSLVDKMASPSASASVTEKENVLVIAPKFAADIDIYQENHQEDWQDNDNDNNNDDHNNYNDGRPNDDDLFLNNNNYNYSGIPNILYWAERGLDLSLWHTWRYGADALNTTKGISSYTVMDRLLEYLIESKQEEQEQGGDEDKQQGSYYNFPNLKKISVIGHSAGGQYVHRWTLLSSNPIIWGDDNEHDDDNGNDDGNDNGNDDGNGIGIGRDGNTNNNVRKIEVRTVVANPRSYCYLDDRRMIRKDGNNSNNDNENDVDGYANANANASVNAIVTMHEDEHGYDGDDNDNNNYYVFAVPDRQDVDTCPTYNQWQWGLEQGGSITCPYKDDILKKYTTNTISSRYANRNVFYLTGEYDTIEQTNRCETYNFQGYTRNERAKRYFHSLKEYFKEESTSLLHQQLHQVPASPHDHTLIFQSKPGLEVIFGSNYIMENEKEEYNSENKIEKVFDDDNDNENDDDGGDIRYSESNSIARHPSLLLMRLKEIMVNLCFSTSSGKLVRRNNGDGSNLRAKKAMQAKTNKQF